MSFNAYAPSWRCMSVFLRLLSRVTIDWVADSHVCSPLAIASSHARPASLKGGCDSAHGRRMDG